MNLQTSNDKIDGKIWQCRLCCSKRSIRTESIFMESKLPIKTCIKLINEFFKHESIDEIRGIYGISSRTTIVNLFKKIRTIIKNYMDDNQPQLGGENIIVQADETLLFKQKHHVGRLPKQHWVVGMLDTFTNDVLIKCVERRTRDGIQTAFQDFVNEDTILHTDGWKAYIKIFENKNITHKVVNHNVNFVDPNTGVNTQRIECLWSNLKKFLRRKSYKNSEYIEQYIAEFIFKRTFKDASLSKFIDLLRRRSH